MSKKDNIFDVLQQTDSISFIFSSTMENIDNVCEKTLSYLRSEICDIKRHLFSINLVIREALTNAVRHGNESDSRKKVQFVLTIVQNKSIKLTIEDEGDGFDWRKQFNKDFPEDDDHGRGTIIMSTYFNHYSYNDKGNILYLEKNNFF